MIVVRSDVGGRRVRQMLADQNPMIQALWLRQSPLPRVQSLALDQGL